MVLRCLYLSWLGDPGYVANKFKSIIANETKVNAEPETALAWHFVRTGETEQRPMKTE
jgi:hypothetical protein